MDLGQIARRLDAADHMHREQWRRGYIGKNRLWSDEETAALRRLYPDYASAAEALPGRTMASMMCKAKILGITRRIHRWTAAEHSRLKSMYPRASREAILEALPRLTWMQIRQHARRYKLKRPMMSYCPTGWPLLDEVRTRCSRLGYSMADLDALAGTKRYFQNHYWRRNKGQASLAVLKAVIALDGALEVQWSAE